MRRKNHIEFSQPENRSRTSGGTIIPALLIICWVFRESSMGNCHECQVQPQTNPSWDCLSESWHTTQCAQQLNMQLNTQHPPPPCWPGGCRINFQWQAGEC